jgi:hypothetical protein
MIADVFQAQKKNDADGSLTIHPERMRVLHNGTDGPIRLSNAPSQFFGGNSMTPLKHVQKRARWNRLFSRPLFKPSKNLLRDPNP